jgi:hypothetical protein
LLMNDFQTTGINKNAVSLKPVNLTRTENALIVGIL